MKEVELNLNLNRRMAEIYRKMEEDYDRVAQKLNFTCQGCPDNCCDSYFQHHTYAEWAYLWLGFKARDEEKQEEILERCRSYQQGCAEALARDERPREMCPLNEGGLCILYKHRLMVCRTHGVPASMLRPDGQRMNFPGCFRCQEIVETKFLHNSEAPHVERTPLLRELALLENELMDGKRHLYPRIKMTIAEMLLTGPPAITTPHCERT
ncbi:MAG: hypothetical protein ABFS19_07400 [Thermodesulfobacteriota bacterium]